MEKLTHERLLELLTYSKNTGKFMWNVHRFRYPAGSEAGSLSEGYTVIKVDGNSYKAHRLAHFYVTGTWPEEQIDHKNGNKTDNKWSNLRDCSHTENTHNVNKSSNNTSGYLGVYEHKANKKWIAQINAYGTRYYLGQFNSPEKAYQAYCEAKAELHPFSPKVRK